MEASFLKANHLLLASPPVSSAIHYLDLSLLAPYKPSLPSLRIWSSIFFPLMDEGIYLFSSSSILKESSHLLSLSHLSFIIQTTTIQTLIYISLLMRPLNRVVENNSFQQVLLLRARLLPAKSLSIESGECLIWHRIQQIPPLQCLWFLPGFLYIICISYVISLQTSFF